MFQKIKKVFDVKSVDKFVYVTFAATLALAIIIAGTAITIQFNSNRTPDNLEIILIDGCRYIKLDRNCI
jgi:hypothetical protein